MNQLTILEATPPWEWPENAGELFLDALRDSKRNEPDRLIAASLAGDSTVVNDEIFHALLSIVHDGNETDDMRGRAAISLGPALEEAHIEDFDDPEEVPISERTFLETQESLRKLFLDGEVPKEVRRRVLEASIRAPQEWHEDAIRTAFSSGDEDWRLTAVFSMGWVRGFNDQILEALDSDNEDIEFQAVCAAGNWEVDAAWPRVAGIVKSEREDQQLLLAAIDAVVGIRPREAEVVLAGLLDVDDEDVVDAAHEAIAMSQALLGELFDDDLDDFGDFGEEGGEVPS